MDIPSQPTRKPVSDQWRPLAAATTGLHIVWLIVSILILLGSLVLRVTDDRQAVTFLGTTLPETCTFKRILGFGCPGCGLTRSFVFLSRGQLLAALSLNPAGLVLYFCVVVQIPYRLLQLHRIRRGLSEWCFDHLAKWFVLLFSILLVGQWVFRVLFAWS